MKICALVTCHNYGRYLESCIGSVFEQSYPVDEIIIVDDGSTDKSISVAREISETDSRVRLIEQENRGQLGAFEAGINACKSEWVFLLDADDIWTKDHCSSLVEVINAHSHVDWAYSQLDFFGKNYSDNPYHYRLPYGDLGESCLWALASFGVSNFPFLATASSAIAFRSEIIRRFLPFTNIATRDWKVCADEVLVLALSLCGAKRFALDKKTVRYRVHDSNNFAGIRPNFLNSRAGAKVRVKAEIMANLGLNDFSVTKLFEEYFACPNRNAFLKKRYAQAALASSMSLDRRLFNWWKIVSSQID